MKIAFIDTLGLSYDGNTLSKRGLGGSESAVILLSKELAQIGFDVTVYNNCIDEDCSSGVYDGVRYIDYTEYQPGEKYDICVLSRSVAPIMSGHKYAGMVIDSSYRVLWMHDTFCEGDQHIEALLQQDYLDEIFTLSDFHSEYVTTAEYHGPRRNFEVLKHRFWLTRNGATYYEDVDTKNKDPMLFVYNASATKGMTTLVQNYWPEIKKHLPDAKLKVIGGFYRFRGGEPDEQEKTVQKMAEDPRNAELGIEFTGVITQHEIAKILGKASLMLYPTEFPETFGISSLESLLYETPIVTNRFGALEETAIDLACYKIDYSSTNNALFQNIDEENQKKEFIETTLRAVSNQYLLQQKRQYCKVARDIASWKTVALQWKQHFYMKLGKFLPVHEYRKADRINKDVARIFGRRFENDETRQEYKCYGPEREIIVISPFWNAQDYIENHILSVARQDYTNYRHYLIDDHSDDDTLSVIMKTISGLPQEIRKKIIIESNAEKRGAAFNHHKILSEHKDDKNKIIMLLDGDDWLINNPTIFKYYNDLYDQFYDFTYGSMWSLADNIPLIAQDYTKDEIKKKLYRGVRFNWGIPYTHLRTFLSDYIPNINWDMLKDIDGDWMMAGHDNPLFYETIKSAKNPKAVKEIMVNYNDINPLNDYKINADKQNENAGITTQKTLTKALTETLDFEDEKTMKKILIAIPTNKGIEPETFRSIYNLKVPKGYTTRFEFFYGYQVDQVRNLIAEWAKHYDYLLSVDSDIVLPEDTLEKMLWLDKDIISGVYIQRIPETHTIEIFEDTPGGGVDHMSWNKLKTSGVTEVAGCGMGACLIKGEVFRTLDYPHFYYKSALDHNQTVSEDVYFCQKARKHGFKIWADPSIICDHIGQTVFKVNTEPRENKLSHLEKIARADLLPRDHVHYIENLNIDPKVIYDIGACVGHWARHARPKWPNAQIFLFDGAKSVKDFMHDMTVKGIAQGYFPGLLSDDNKPVKFYEDTFNPGGNSYYKETTGYFDDIEPEIRDAYKLDEVVSNNMWPMPDLIKMDVQGAELDVLKGATNCLSGATDIILEAQTENYNDGAPKIDEIKSFLEENGYELVSRFCAGAADADYHFRKV